MVSLTELDVSSNSLEELPIGIGLLRHLRTLYADDNFLTCLPAELGSCLRLTILSLRTNNLSSIPDEIGRIPNLHVLNLSDNKLRSLPFGLMKLKNLSALWLADNQTKPLVKLQTESDPVTGSRVLTCYLLPQQTQQALDDDYDSEAGDSLHPSAWEERLKRRQIQFEFDETSLQEHRHLQRTPTPYPKELKRRLQCRRELALSERLSSGSSRRISGDGVVRGRRSERLNGVRVSADRAVDGRRIRSPLVAERHILLKADKEKHLRDKFRMQHSGGAVAATNNTAGGCDVDAAGEKADGISLSAGTERINSEEIQSLDKSPQRGAVVRGRRESECNTTAKITSPSHTAVTVDNGQRSVPVRSGSPDKKAHSQSTIRSPVQTTTNTDVVTVDHVSVVSCGGETRLTRLPHSSGGRASGHVSDSASRPHGRNDRRLRTSASGTGRSGYVSDTSFSAIVHSSANDSLRSTAAEGDAAVSRQQNAVSNADQLDAANNNAGEKPSSNQYSDIENNNIGPQSSPHHLSVNSSVPREPANCADDGIQIMPYSDFVRSRMARGLPAPRGVVVRGSGRHGLVPHYVVQHHRQHRAHVRSLRRHGYESEDGRIAGQHYDSHGHVSNQHHGQHRPRRAAAGHGYDSDIGYRSDVAGYSSNRSVQHRTVLYPNPSVYSSDFTSGDWHYSSDHDVHRQKTTPSSSFVARPSHNGSRYERDVRETITEEVMDSEGQPNEQGRLLQGPEWPSSVQVQNRSRLTNQYRVNPVIAYPYEAEYRHNRPSSRRRNFEPIEL